MRWMLVAFALGLSLGCGTEAPPATDDFHCCVNKAWYTCTDAADVGKCVKDPTVCTRDASKDSQC